MKEVLIALKFITAPGEGGLAPNRGLNFLDDFVNGTLWPWFVLLGCWDVGPLCSLCDTQLWLANAFSVALSGHRACYFLGSVRYFDTWWHILAVLSTSFNMFGPCLVPVHSKRCKVCDRREQFKLGLGQLPGASPDDTALWRCFFSSRYVAMPGWNGWNRIEIVLLWSNQLFIEYRCVSLLLHSLDLGICMELSAIWPPISQDEKHVSPMFHSANETVWIADFIHDSTCSTSTENASHIVSLPSSSTEQTLSHVSRMLSRIFEKVWNQTDWLNMTESFGS